MHYSKELVSKFRKQYQRAFGLEIAPEVADLELYRLARLIQVLHLTVFDEEGKDYDYDESESEQIQKPRTR